ncbi:MAG: hypothetical protein ABIJ59_13630 [Pseudomonadota bacterium]
MSKEKQIDTADKNKSNCSCGCIGVIEKKAKESKPPVEKSKQ